MSRHSKEPERWSHNPDRPCPLDVMRGTLDTPKKKPPNPRADISAKPDISKEHPGDPPKFILARSIENRRMRRQEWIDRTKNWFVAQKPKFAEIFRAWSLPITVTAFIVILLLAFYMKRH